jgi:hypothetical protein
VAKTVRQNLIDFIAGITLALVVFLTASEAHRVYRLLTLHTVPAEEFFEPIQLNIPDFSVGQNPVIFYDRIIHKEFVANWVVEVQLIQDNGQTIAVCTGNGHNIYQPEKGLPEEGATFAWFIGAPCSIAPGSYRMVANWSIERPAAVGNVETRIVSNVFQVTQHANRN